MAAEPILGQWRVSPCVSGRGYRAGWYVERTNNGKTEWLKTSRGRAKRFDSQEDAFAAIDKANAIEEDATTFQPKENAS